MNKLMLIFVGSVLFALTGCATPKLQHNNQWLIQSYDKGVFSFRDVSTKVSYTARCDSEDCGGTIGLVGETISTNPLEFPNMFRTGPYIVVAWDAEGKQTEHFLILSARKTEN